MSNVSIATFVDGYIKANFMLKFCKLASLITA